MKKQNMLIIILSILAVIILFIFLTEVNIFKKEDCGVAENYITNREYDEAEKVYLKLMNNKEENIQATYGLARLYYSQKRYDDADILFKRLFNALKENNDISDNTSVYLALVAEGQGDCDSAIEHITRLNELKPHVLPEKNGFFGNIPLVLSRCYLKKGDDSKAIAYLEEHLKNKLDEKSLTKTLMQMGRNFLELADYEEAKKYLTKEEISQGLIDVEKKELGHLLSMIYLGEKKYEEISNMSNSEAFFQGSIENLVYGFYSSAIADIKQNKFEEGREKLNKIFNTAIGKLDVKDYYNFYYFSFLGYYGLGSLDFAQNKYENAEENFKKIVEISEKISPLRYESFIEKNNLIFLRLLAHYELAHINYEIKNNIEQAKNEINAALNIINNLTEKEKRIIELKEIGNNGSIVEKINDYNIKIYEEN